MKIKNLIILLFGIVLSFGGFFLAVFWEKNFWLGALASFIMLIGVDLIILSARRAKKNKATTATAV
jgi:hypothetical protein